jgi:hypothetical protein
MNRACSADGREENSMQASGGKCRMTVPLGRPKRIWDNGIKMHLRETE